MEEINIKQDTIRESKEYLSISTRLPQVNLIQFRRHCSQLKLSPSERIRDLILKDITKPSKQFLAGKNKIRYERTTNSFKWIIELDSGQEIEILNNLPDSFLKNLNQEIDKALLERNDWIHNTKKDSIAKTIFTADFYARKASLSGKS